MTGSALFDFLIVIIVLIAMIAVLMLVIPRASPDALFTRIAQIVIGVGALIAFLLALRGVFFGGGGGMSVSPLALIYFGIAVIVALIVLYLINAVLDWLLGVIGLPTIATAVKYVIGGIVLIALMYYAGDVLFGGGHSASFLPHPK